MVQLCSTGTNHWHYMYGIKMEKWSCNYRHRNYSHHTRHSSAAELWQLATQHISKSFPPPWVSSHLGNLLALPEAQAHTSRGKEHYLLQLELHRSYVRFGHRSHQCFSKAATVQTEPSAASRCVCTQRPQKIGRVQVLVSKDCGKSLSRIYMVQILLQSPIKILIKRYQHPFKPCVAIKYDH